MKWNWGNVEQGRISRAHKVKIVSLDLNSSNPSAECVGSSGTHYRCTLERCTCPDFSINENKGKRQPCKHMIALAMKCNLLNDEGLTFEEDTVLTAYELAVKYAIASGFYHLKKPIVSDPVYDALKWEMWDYCGWVEEEDVNTETTLNKADREIFDMSLDDFLLYVKRFIAQDYADEEKRILEEIELERAKEIELQKAIMGVNQPYEVKSVSEEVSDAGKEAPANTLALEEFARRYC